MIRTDLNFSGKRDRWLIDLAGVIAEHMCCEVTMIKWSRTYYISIWVYEEDVQVVKQSIEYATAFVRDHNKRQKEQLKDLNYPTKAIRDLGMSYGLGFAKGLEAAYDKESNSVTDFDPGCSRRGYELYGERN